MTKTALRELVPVALPLVSLKSSTPKRRRVAETLTFIFR